MKLINNIKIKRLIKQGLTIGENFKMEKGCMIDASFPWLITIGSNVTLAPYSYILSHDGSSKSFIGYSKVGKVVIGNNVFIGSKSIILPGITIGNNVIIAAGSIVTKDIESDTIVAGNPAKVIGKVSEFRDKNLRLMTKENKFDVSFTKRGKIKCDKKRIMKNILEYGFGFVD